MLVVCGPFGGILPADNSCRNLEKICKGQTRNSSVIHTEISCKETVVPTPVPNFNGQHSIVKLCFMGDNIVLFFRGSQMYMKLKAGESVVEQHEPLDVVCAIVNFIITYILLYWWQARWPNGSIIEYWWTDMELVVHSVSHLLIQKLL